MTTEFKRTIQPIESVTSRLSKMTAARMMFCFGIKRWHHKYLTDQEINDIMNTGCYRGVKFEYPNTHRVWEL